MLLIAGSLVRVKKDGVNYSEYWSGKHAFLATCPSYRVAYWSFLGCFGVEANTTPSLVGSGLHSLLCNSMVALALCPSTMGMASDIHCLRLGNSVFILGGRILLQKPLKRIILGIFLLICSGSLLYSSGIPDIQVTIGGSESYLQCDFVGFSFSPKACFIHRSSNHENPHYSGSSLWPIG